MMWSEESSSQSMRSLPGLLSMMDDGRWRGGLNCPIEEGAISVSYAIAEEGVVHHM